MCMCGGVVEVGILAAVVGWFIRLLTKRKRKSK